jgi:hypothetical protein
MRKSRVLGHLVAGLRVPALRGLSNNATFARTGDRTGQALAVHIVPPAKSAERAADTALRRGGQAVDNFSDRLQSVLSGFRTASP